MPLITAGQEPRFRENAAALREMTGANFDPARFVYLPSDAEPFVTATNRSQVKILSRHFAAQDVGAEVDASAPAMVVVAQSYYHCWHAYVDGQPTRLFRANYAFQALQVPAGRHVVRLAYEDNFFRLGSGLSLGSLAGCLVLLARRSKGWPA